MPCSSKAWRKLCHPWLFWDERLIKLWYSGLWRILKTTPLTRDMFMLRSRWKETPRRCFLSVTETLWLVDLQFSAACLCRHPVRQEWVMCRAGVKELRRGTMGASPGPYTSRLNSSSPRWWRCRKVQRCWRTWRKSWMYFFPEIKERST